MDNKKRIIILCESYASILYPLYRLSYETSDIPVTIFIPTLKDLYQLFLTMNEKVFDNKLELIYYPPYTQKWMKTKGIKRLLYLLPGILGERRHLKRFYNEYFTRLKGADVMFSSPAYSAAKIYSLRRLNKKNKIIFIDPGPPYICKYSPRSLRDIATLLIYKMIYGKDTQLGQFPEVNPWSKGFPFISEKFMKKSIDSIIDWSNRDEIMESFAWERFRLFDTGGYKVIYFHQDLVDRDVPDRDKFSRELKDIFDIILRYYPEKQIARKYHPAHELNKDVIEVGEEIPAYIPAEFLYNEKVELYLGISSYSIVNVRGGGVAISLANLITFNTDELGEQQKEFLINASRTEILFPETLEELEQILSKISDKRM